MSIKPKIKPELKGAWERADDCFSSLLSGRQTISFDKEVDGEELLSLKPISPPAVLSKMMIMNEIPTTMNKEQAFVSLVEAFIANRYSVVSSMVDKDMYGKQTFHRSSIEVEDTAEKFVMTGIKLEK